MKTYEVVMSESVATWIEVKANTEEEAIKKVQEGYYSNDNIIKEECLDRSIESAEEVEE
jgi:DpnD/PcfM-like protein